MDIAEKKVSELTAEELEQILADKKQKEAESRIKKREAYEGIRADVVKRIEDKVRKVTEEVYGLFTFVNDETDAFKKIMSEYGQLLREDQLSFRLAENNFKIEVKTNKVKGFDERADVAASRLIEFLQNWISNRDKGTDDPMYQLAMTLLERNKYGDLDYKSISKLYDLETKFNNDEYTDIMSLFKESNVVETTATNFYFFEKTKQGVWKKLEPSFNRL
ncbi:DUF3164 family protein [Carboxylicivirga linearis]|uniref:DUF3164 family protein n=1 Tax=Carboxylicivirga linearis TaxID=1628157 RepID=A0ABS5JZY2_9BACT|nr:DUF3164 family protein [Carboxylicivirga linearis]MBS2100418.1 DUF3164 family protein [Carboxylicivirga linearis]